MTGFRLRRIRIRSGAPAVGRPHQLAKVGTSVKRRGIVQAHFFTHPLGNVLPRNGAIRARIRDRPGTLGLTLGNVGPRIEYRSTALLRQAACTLTPGGQVARIVAVAVAELSRDTVKRVRVNIHGVFLAAGVCAKSNVGMGVGIGGDSCFPPILSCLKLHRVMRTRRWGVKVETQDCVSTGLACDVNRLTRGFSHNALSTCVKRPVSQAQRPCTLRARWSTAPQQQTTRARRQGLHQRWAGLGALVPPWQ